MGVDPDRIVPLTTGGTAAPLFCVHAISGSPWAYTGLAGLLGPDQPVYGIEAPGFDDVREPVRSLPALAEEYAQTLRAVHPAEDYQLLGWSMGGVIAYDMARRLTRDGIRVSRVILVDVALPWVAELPPEREIQRRLLRDLMGVAGAVPSGLEAVFAELPEDVDPTVTFAAIEKAAILPEEIDAEILEDRYRVFRAHLEALFAYAATEPYDGPVTHVLAAGSPREYMRWDRLLSDYREHTLAGDHHSIWTGDSLVALAGIVRENLVGGAPTV